MTECRGIGEMKMCPENSLSCMVEVRKRDGDLESVSCLIWLTCSDLSIKICMGCKAPEACADNKAQNFVGPWAQRQCRPGKKIEGPSVCRQCCNTVGCEQILGDDLPTSPAAWKSNLIV